MSRYIDDDEALKTIKKMLYETALNNFTTDRKFADDCEEIAEHRLATWVSLVPTSDVVEVVRCKDCKYYSYIQMGSNPGVCAVNILAYTATEPENYCGYGERKENE